MPTTPTADQVQADFDRIAALEDGTTDNRDYHPFLLRQLPVPCDTVVEIGCGSGGLARAIAAYAGRVIAVDFSPRMIESARRQSASFSNIEYVQVDVRDWSVPNASVDCVVSVTTLHHLDHEPFLRSVCQWLRPGGRLLIVDLVLDAGMVDMLRSSIAYPASAALRLLRTGRLGMPRDLRDAWRAHGNTDRYLSFTDAKSFYGAELPGAKIRRHFFWRYSVVWTKPS